MANVSDGLLESLTISLPVQPSPLPRIREFSVSKLVPGGMGMSVNNWNAVAGLDVFSDEEVWVNRPLLPSQALKITKMHASVANVIRLEVEKYKGISQFTFRNFGILSSSNPWLKANF